MQADVTVFRPRVANRLLPFGGISIVAWSLLLFVVTAEVFAVRRLGWQRALVELVWEPPNKLPFLVGLVVLWCIVALPGLMEQRQIWLFPDRLEMRSGRRTTRVLPRAGLTAVALCRNKVSRSDDLYLTYAVPDEHAEDVTQVVSCWLLGERSKQLAELLVQDVPTGELGTCPPA